MKKLQNVARQLLTMTVARAGLSSWSVLISSPAEAARAATSQPAARAVANGKFALGRDAKFSGGSRQPIRNDSDSICSDSIDLDSNVQQVMIPANPFVTRQVDKGLKSAART